MTKRAAVEVRNGILAALLATEYRRLLPAEGGPHVFVVVGNQNAGQGNPLLLGISYVVLIRKQAVDPNQDATLMVGGVSQQS